MNSMIVAAHATDPSLATFENDVWWIVLIKIVGVTAYDEKFPIIRYLMDTLSYPIIEGSNVGVRRRQLQALFRTPGYDPLSASGMA